MGPTPPDAEAEMVADCPYTYLIIDTGIGIRKLVFTVTTISSVRVHPLLSVNCNGICCSHKYSH